MYCNQQITDTLFGRGSMIAANNFSKTSGRYPAESLITLFDS